MYYTHHIYIIQLDAFVFCASSDLSCYVQAYTLQISATLSSRISSFYHLRRKRYSLFVFYKNDCFSSVYTVSHLFLYCHSMQSDCTDISINHLPLMYPKLTVFQTCCCNALSMSSTFEQSRLPLLSKGQCPSILSQFTNIPGKEWNLKLFFLLYLTFIHAQKI